MSVRRKGQGPAAAVVCAAAAVLASFPNPARADPPATPSAAVRGQDYADYFRATLALEQGDFAAAAQSFEALAQRDPAAGWRDQALFAHLAAGDPGSALQTAQTPAAAGLPPSDLAALVLAADALHRRQWREAQAQLGALNPEAPAHLRLAAGLLQAWALTARGEDEAALDMLLRLPRPRAIAATTPFQRAMILEWARRHDEAAAAYSEAVAGQRLLVEDILRYAAFLRRREGQAQAEGFLQRMQGRIGNVAFEAARQGAYQPPAPTPARNAALGLIGYGRGLAAEDNLPEAAVILTLALIADPDQEGGRLALTTLLRDMGQAARAEAVAGAIDESSVYWQVAQVEIAEIRQEADRLDEALVIARAAAAHTGGGRFAVRAVAELALDAGHYAEAEQAFSALIAQQSSDNPQWRLLLGRAEALRAQGRWPEAEADLRAALTIAEDEPALLTALAQGWIAEGQRLDEALALLQRAEDMDNRDPVVLAALGEAHLRLGQQEAAIAALERALRRNPGSAPIAERLGDALWLAGQRREARFQWARALAREQDAERRAVLDQKLLSGLTQAP